MPVQSPLAPEYLASLQKALQRPTSLAHSLPGPSDLAFHRSIDGKLAAKLDDVNSRLLTVLRGLIGLVDEEGERKHAREEEGILDDWANDWGDGVDRLLERAVSGSCRYTEGPRRLFSVDARLYVLGKSLLVKRRMIDPLAAGPFRRRTSPY